MVLNFFDYLTGTLVTALEVSSYNIVVDFTNPAESTFEISRRTYRKDRELVKTGQIAIIRPRYLTKTPFEGGWIGIVSSTTETDDSFKITAKYLTSILGFEMIPTAIEGVAFYKYVQQAISNQLLNSTDYTSCDLSAWLSINNKLSSSLSGTLPAYDSDSVQDFVDVLNDLYDTAGIIVYPTDNSSSAGMKIRMVIDKASDIGNIFYNKDYISGFSITNELDDSSPNVVVLRPNADNVLSAETYYYYLHTDGEIDDSGNYDRIYPIVKKYITYDDDTYYQSEESPDTDALESLATAEFAKSVKNFEVTLTIKANSIFPLNTLKPRCKATIIKDHVSYSANLTKLQMSSTDEVKATFGYTRRSMTEQLHNSFAMNNKMEKEIENIKRRFTLFRGE